MAFFAKCLEANVRRALMAFAVVGVSLASLAEDVPVDFAAKATEVQGKITAIASPATSSLITVIAGFIILWGVVFLVRLLKKGAKSAS